MYNLPNLLTISRIVVIPVIFLSLYIHSFVWTMFVAVLFVAAAVTDYFDGYLARCRNETSAFGRLLDPIADKLLVASALVVILAKPGMVWSDLSYIPAFIILCREILVSGLREFLREVNVGLPVTRLAKWKTGFQMTAISMILLQHLPYIGTPVGVLGEWLLWVAGILTFITGYQYFDKCLDYIYTVENKKKNPVKQMEQEVKKIAVRVKKSVEKAVEKKTAGKRGRKPKAAGENEDGVKVKTTAAKTAVKTRRRKKRTVKKAAVKAAVPAKQEPSVGASAEKKKKK